MSDIHKTRFRSGSGSKWPDKSTTSYAMLDFESERHILQIQDMQYLKFN